MVVEMDMGIICGCLSGVKPVLATLFPRLFGTNSRERSRATGRSNTSQFHPLSDFGGTSNNNNKSSTTKKLEHEFSIQSLTGAEESPRTLAWASAGGERGARLGVPAGAIGVESVVEVEEEEENRGKKGSDSSSEEWIMEDMVRCL